MSRREMVRTWCGDAFVLTPEFQMLPELLMDRLLKIEPYSCMVVHGRIRPAFSVGLDD